jgi:hypothetical protein
MSVDIYAVGPDPYAEVRCCADCGAPALVCVQVVEHQVGNVKTEHIRRECICQSCGARVNLRSPQFVRLVPWLGGILLLVYIPLMSWALISGLFGLWLVALFLLLPLAVIFAGLRFKKAWQQHPLVPGAPFPGVRYRKKSVANRRCAGCGDIAAVTNILHQRVNGIPAGIEYTYSCVSCSRQFTIRSGSLYVLQILAVVLFLFCGVIALLEAGSTETYLLATFGFLMGGYILYELYSSLRAQIRNPKI